MTVRTPASPSVMVPFDVTAFLRFWADASVARSDIRSAPDTCTGHVLAHAPVAPHVPDILACAENAPELTAYAQALADACWGLLPGVHRLRLRAPKHVLDVHSRQHLPQDRPQVLHLTLCIGERAPLDALMAATPSAAVPDRTQAVTILGAGLAGASCARALAERGYRVTVLDQGDTPAAGASGLPVGLVAPHTSPDDSRLSRLSRAGVRAMRDVLHAHLVEGENWGDSGVQERRLPGKTRKGGAPASWSDEHRDAGAAWTRALTDAGLPPNTLWHAKGAWVRPARLVAALLDHPNICWQAATSVTKLTHQSTGWQVWGVTRGTDSDDSTTHRTSNAASPASASPADTLLADSPQLILACGPATPRLLAASGFATDTVPIRPLRGQLSWGLMADTDVASCAAALPASPVNGNGCFVHGIPTPQGPAWFAGSTFDRLRDQAVLDAADHAENFERLQALLPEVAMVLEPLFAQDRDEGRTEARVKGWAGVRCSVPDRLPMVGALPHVPAGLWVCSAMGSRGLTLALLCGELLAAQWTGEPLPVEPQLARALAATRFA